VPSSTRSGEEREAYHLHECPVCMVEWEHGSRQCDGVVQRECEGCESVRVMEEEW